jgi:hypothetical protein
LYVFNCRQQLLTEENREQQLDNDIQKKKIILFALYHEMKEMAFNGNTFSL